MESETSHGLPLSSFPSHSSVDQIHRWGPEAIHGIIFGICTLVLAIPGAFVAIRLFYPGSRNTGTTNLPLGDNYLHTWLFVASICFYYLRPVENVENPNQDAEP